MLVKGELQQTILTADLGVLLRLEGCLSGNVPEEGLATPARGLQLVRGGEAGEGRVRARARSSTRRRARSPRASRAKQAAKAREAEAAAEAARRLVEAAAATRPPSRSGSRSRRARSCSRSSPRRRCGSRCATASRASRRSTTSTSSRSSCSTRAAGSGEPKARFAYLFPSNDAALIQIRMKPTLSESRARGGGRPRSRRRSRTTQFTLERGGQYYVTGVPVVVDGLAERRQGLDLRPAGAPRCW